MIRNELQLLKTDTRTLRRFGLVVGAVLVALGVAGWRRHHLLFPYALGIGAALVVAGAVVPGRLRLVYRAWMALGLLVGMIMSSVLLTALFYLVVTPLGWIARLGGKDFLQQRRPPAADSYWQMRDPAQRKPPADYERQF
jgi:hypothetical protein